MMVTKEILKQRYDIGINIAIRTIKENYYLQKEFQKQIKSLEKHINAINKKNLEIHGGVFHTITDHISYFVKDIPPYLSGAKTYSDFKKGIKIARDIITFWQQISQGDFNDDKITNLWLLIKIKELNTLDYNILNRSLDDISKGSIIWKMIESFYKLEKLTDLAQKINNSAKDLDPNFIPPQLKDNLEEIKQNFSTIRHDLLLGKLSIAKTLIRLPDLNNLTKVKRLSNTSKIVLIAILLAQFLGGCTAISPKIESKQINKSVIPVKKIPNEQIEKYKRIGIGSYFYNDFYEAGYKFEDVKILLNGKILPRTIQLAAFRGIDIELLKGYVECDFTLREKHELIIKGINVKYALNCKKQGLDWGEIGLIGNFAANNSNLKEVVSILKKYDEWFGYKYRVYLYAAGILPEAANYYAKKLNSSQIITLFKANIPLLEINSKLVDYGYKNPDDFGLVPSEYLSDFIIRGIDKKFIIEKKGSHPREILRSFIINQLTKDELNLIKKEFNIDEEYILNVIYNLELSC